jgi:hypothetical protein
MAQVGPYLQTGPMIKTTPFNDVFGMTTTTYLRSDGGRFVTLNTGTGFYSLTTATAAQADGWVDPCYSVSNTGNPPAATPYTTDTTVNEYLPGTKEVFQPRNAFLMPLATGQTIAATNENQDYGFAIQGSGSTTQQVLDLTNTSYKVVKVIEADIANNLAWVIALVK